MCIFCNIPSTVNSIETLHSHILSSYPNPSDFLLSLLLEGVLLTSCRYIINIPNIAGLVRIDCSLCESISQISPIVGRYVNPNNIYYLIIG